MFVRCLTTIIVSFVLIAGVQWYRGWSAPPAPGIVRVRVDQLLGATEEMRQTWREMEEQEQRRDAFMRFEARIVHEMALEEISLRDAAERSFYYCLQHYPEHLVNVNNAERGLHLKTKHAKNIVGALEAHHEDFGGDPAVVDHFRCELAALTYEPDAGTSIAPQ